MQGAALFKGFRTWKDHVSMHKEVCHFNKLKGTTKVIERLKMVMFKSLFTMFARWKKQS
jgi:hypothetical protein